MEVDWRHYHLLRRARHRYLNSRTFYHGRSSDVVCFELAENLRFTDRVLKTYIASRIHDLFEIDGQVLDPQRHTFINLKLRPWSPENMYDNIGTYYLPPHEFITDNGSCVYPEWWEHVENGSDLSSRQLRLDVEVINSCSLPPPPRGLRPIEHWSHVIWPLLPTFMPLGLQYQNGPPPEHVRAPITCHEYARAMNEGRDSVQTFYLASRIWDLFKKDGLFQGHRHEPLGCDHYQDVEVLFGPDLHPRLPSQWSEEGSNERVMLALLELHNASIRNSQFLLPNFMQEPESADVSSRGFPWVELQEHLGKIPWDHMPILRLFTEAYIRDMYKSDIPDTSTSAAIAVRLAEMYLRDPPSDYYHEAIQYLATRINELYRVADIWPDSLPKSKVDKAPAWIDFYRGGTKRVVPLPFGKFYGKRFEALLWELETVARLLPGYGQGAEAGPSGS